VEGAAAIEDRGRLARYPFYHAAQGELELRRGNHIAAGGHFRDAVELARNPMERRFLQQRVQECVSASSRRAGAGRP